MYLFNAKFNALNYDNLKLLLEIVMSVLFEKKLKNPKFLLSPSLTSLRK